MLSMIPNWGKAKQNHNETILSIGDDFCPKDKKKYKFPHDI